MPQVQPPSIGPVQPGESHQRSQDVAFKEAQHPGRVNRSSVIPAETETHFGGGTSGTRSEDTPLPEYDIHSIHPDDVKPKMTGSSKKIESTPSKADQALKDKVDNLEKNLSQALIPSKSGKGDSSKQGIESQLTQAGNALKSAKGLQKQADQLARAGLNSQNMLGFSLPDGQKMSGTEQAAVKLHGKASELVKVWDKDVKRLKQELKSIQTEDKRQARAGRRGRTAEGKLQAGIKSLEKSASGLSDKVVTPDAETKKEFGKHIRSLEKAISKAESVVKQGKRLDRRSDAAARAHGIDVKDVKNRASDAVNKAQTELRTLKNDLSIARSKRKSIGQSEALERKKQKKAQAHEREQKRVLSRANRKLARAEREFRKSVNKTLKQDASEDKAIQEKHEAAGRKAPSKVAVHKEKKAIVKSTSKGFKQTRELHTLKPVTDSRPFLSGVKPVSDLSARGIENAFSKLSTQSDYKKALVSIRESKLGLKEKLRLRSLLSSAMLGAIKNDQKFKKLDRTLVELVMHGDSMGEIQVEYQKAVKRAEAKLDASIRRE